MLYHISVLYFKIIFVLVKLLFIKLDFQKHFKRMEYIRIEEMTGNEI